MNRLNIIYEDNHIIVADKPPGILTQGDYSGETSLLDLVREYIRVRYNKPGQAFAGLVHRLDRPVSGLLVFAKTSKAAARLQREFTSGRIRKFYLAVIENSSGLNEGWNTLENRLLRERDITRTALRPSEKTERAVLHYHLLIKKERYSLVLIKLDTGKKHQIRAQFAGLNSPVAGDRKYGSHIDTGESILLHSAFLSFKHPTKDETMSFYSEPPGSFEKFIPFDRGGISERVKNLAESFDSGKFIDLEPLQR